MAVLVLNEGEDTLEVNVTGGNFFKGLKILKHHKERVRACNFNLLSQVALDSYMYFCLLCHTTPQGGLVYVSNFCGNSFLWPGG